MLEGDQYVTSSLVVPTIYNIMYYTDPLSLLRVPWSLTGRTMSHAQLHVEVQEARVEYSTDLQRRFRHDIDTCTKSFWFHCSLLDPRFRSLKNILGLTDSEITGARASFDSLYRMHWSPTLELSCSDSDEPEISEPVRATPIRNETADCGRRAPVNLMSFLSPEQGTQGDEPQPESPIVDELQLYFSLPDASLDTDPLEWWPKHEKLLPSLSRMARQFLGVPASSAAVERLFSGVGQDFCKQRQAMSEETLEEVTRARSYVKRKYSAE